MRCQAKGNKYYVEIFRWKIIPITVKIWYNNPERRRNMRLKYIDIDKIKVCPNQPRSFFDTKALQYLAESVRKYGIIEPVCVRRVRGKYEVISGERRIRAARMVGMKKVPAIVRFIKNDAALPSALIGNTGRQSISIFDEGEAFKKIVERSIITRKELASRIGTSEESILAKIKALDITDRARRIAGRYGLDEWQVTETMRISDRIRQEELLEIAGKERLTPDEIRRLIANEGNENQVDVPTRKQVVKNERIYINTIRNTVSMMNEAGGVAKWAEKEDDEYILFTLEIKK